MEFNNFLGWVVIQMVIHPFITLIIVLASFALYLVAVDRIGKKYIKK